MTQMQPEKRNEMFSSMSAETMHLYSTLTEENKAKVTHLIETLLIQQSNGLQSSGLQP